MASVNAASLRKQKHLQNYPAASRNMNCTSTKRNKNYAYKRTKNAIKRARQIQSAKTYQNREPVQGKSNLCNDADSFVEIKEEEIDQPELNLDDEDFIAPFVTLEADSLDNVTEGNRCLICFDHDPDPRPLKGLLPKSKRLTNPELLGDDLRIIYLLKMIFQWSTAELRYLMKLSECQSPREWIHVCQPCRLLIIEIQMLEDRIRDCRKKIRNKIMETEEEEMSNSIPVITGTMMTRRIRGLANQQMRSANENSVFIDGDRQAEELLKIKLSRSTYEPIEEESSDSVDGYRETEQLKSLRIESDFLDPPNDLGESGNNQCEDLSEEVRQKPIPVPLEPEISSTPTQFPIEKENVVKSVKKKVSCARASRKKQATTHYFCPTCPTLTEMNLDAFIAHLIFHWRRPIKCLACKSYLPFVPEVIDEHWQQHHPDLDPQTEVKFEPVQSSAGKVFRCGKCPKKFESFQERNEHEQSRHKKLDRSRTAECSVCNVGFMNNDELRLNRVIDHPEVASVSCYYCEELFPAESLEGFKYLDIEALKQHCLEKEGRKIFNLQTCDLCGEVIKDTDHCLKTHYSRKHIGLRIYNSCFICHKDIHYRNIWRHVAFKHGKNSICDICGDEMRPGKLPLHMYQKHEVIMEGYKKYSCDKDGCSYATIYRSSFMKHFSGHQNQNKERLKKHKCSICDKAFGTVARLKEHEERHQTEDTKPFQCEICGGRYATARDLSNHNRLCHLNLKPPSSSKLQKCDQCEYTSTKNLKRHIELVHTNKKGKGYKPTKIACFLGCSASFANLNMFDQHLVKVHSMELEEEELVFHSEEEFEAWRSALRERDFLSYSKWGRAKGTKIYLCNRSSLCSRKSQGKNLRKAKAGGSIVSDKVCRSRIIVKFEGTTLKVTFLKPHTGHVIEPNRKVARISSPVKRKIAMDIMNGATKKQILDRLREGQGEYGGMTRSHLINTQDIANICKKYNLSAPFDVRVTSPNKRKRCKR